MLSILTALSLDVAGAETARKFSSRDVVSPKAYYPEGPQLLPGGALLVAEMPMDRIVKISSGSIEVAFEQANCGPTSIKRIPSGGYWILCHLGHRVLRVSEKFEPVAVIEYASPGSPITWPNDASVDDRGNIYLSSSGQFSLSSPAEGRVIRIDSDSNKGVELVGGIRYSNGVLVRRDRNTIIVSEHLNRRILEFDFAPDGRLINRRVFFDFTQIPPLRAMYEQSGPDGIAQFKDGSIIVADYGNGRLLYLSPDGKYLSTIDVALKFVTNVAIAGDEKSIFVVMTRDNSSRELDGVVQRFEVEK
jgi:sugar lactone lactonase YvrE